MSFSISYSTNKVQVTQQAGSPGHPAQLSEELWPGSDSAAALLKKGGDKKPEASGRQAKAVRT